MKSNFGIYISSRVLLAFIEELLPLILVSLKPS